MTNKTCTKCGVSKPATTEFFTPHQGKYFRPDCRECKKKQDNQYYRDNRDARLAQAADYRDSTREELARKSREYHHRNRAEVLQRMRDAALVRTYGITKDQYDMILDMQGGVCAICGASPKRKSLAVDHDHETGAIRGILCTPCNTAIGRFGDNEEGVLRVVEYLRNGPGIITAVVGGGGWSSLEIL